MNKLNSSGQYSVTLTKTFTDHKDYIVIYDASTKEYNAVNIATYTKDMDPATFLATVGGIHYDLDIIPGHYEAEADTEYNYDCSCWIDTYDSYWVDTKYRDREADMYFEVQAASGKDLEKFAALAQEAVVENRAQDMSSRLGLSLERSQEVVRLTMAWQRSGGKNLSVDEQDSFSKELLGFSITDAKKAMTSSSTEASMDQLIDKAAQTNGTSPENVRRIMNTILK